MSNFELFQRYRLRIMQSVKEKHPHARTVLEDYIREGGASEEVKRYYGKGKT